MRRYMRRGMTGREKRRLLLFLVCAALIALAVTAMTQLRPILTSLATARVSNAVTRVVNTSVNETLYDAGVDYDRLISLEKDNEGHITAVKSNMAEFNRLQSAVLADVLQRLSEVSTRELAIPLGSLTGSPLLAGRGPLLHIKMQSVGSSSAHFENAFASAGINQTRHRILIEVHAGFRILTPFGGEDREIVSTYPVTDTVIVGTVPERYAYISGSGSDLLGEIRDYDSEK